MNNIIETGNRKQETGNRKQETGNRKQETGNRKQETGNRVYFHPQASDANKYINLMQEAISLAGYKIYQCKLKYDILNSSIIHLNWFAFVGTGLVRSTRTFLKKLLFLYALRIFRKKIIFTLHNKTNHDVENRNTKAMYLMVWLLKHSYKIIIHSTESISVIMKLTPDIDTSRIVYVPHPNYITAYHNMKHYTHYVKQNHEIVFLFLGLIRPYKNIEILLQAANQLQGITDIHFLICGRGNEEYQAQLLSMIESRNVTADFRFIEDDEIPSLLELSDALITPYNTESALNSGAANLAFSFGRTVIGTWTGTTRDVDESLVYCYDYTDDEAEHVSRLKDAIMKFYEDFKHDEASVKAKGEKLREIMITEHSLEKVAEGLSKAYA